MENLTQAEYRAIEALGSTDIKTLLENPYLFKNGVKKEPTDNLILGSLIHTLILEPKKLDDEYIIMPELNLRTNADKAVKAELEAEAKVTNKTLVKAEIYNQAEAVSKSFLNSSLSLFLRGEVKAEASFFGEIDGVKVKARPDLIIPDQKIIIDFKTTSQVGGGSADGFAKMAANFAYYIQASLYLEITKYKKFYFIVLETAEPYMVGCYKLDSEALEFGKSEIRRAIEIYKNLGEYKSPLYLNNLDFSKVQEINLPSWTYYKRN